MENQNLANWLEKSKKNDEKEEKPDPYTWNALLARNGISAQSDTDMRGKLSKAHFAIVLDYLELKKDRKSTRLNSSHRT